MVSIKQAFCNKKRVIARKKTQMIKMGRVKVLQPNGFLLLQPFKQAAAVPKVQNNNTT
jgi:hypothetical protein